MSLLLWLACRSPSTAINIIGRVWPDCKPHLAALECKAVRPVARNWDLQLSVMESLPSVCKNCKTGLCLQTMTTRCAGSSGLLSGATRRCQDWGGGHLRQSLQQTPCSSATHDPAAHNPCPQPADSSIVAEASAILCRHQSPSHWCSKALPRRGRRASASKPATSSCLPPRPACCSPGACCWTALLCPLGTCCSRAPTAGTRGVK